MREIAGLFAFLFVWFSMVVIAAQIDVYLTRKNKKVSK